MNARSMVRCRSRSPRVTQGDLRIEDLGDFRGERLARYKHPKGLEIVDALPRNPSGKVLKTELRTRFGTSAAAQSGSPSTDPARGESS